MLGQATQYVQANVKLRIGLARVIRLAFLLESKYLDLIFGAGATSKQTSLGRGFRKRLGHTSVLTKTPDLVGVRPIGHQLSSYLCLWS